MSFKVNGFLYIFFTTHTRWILHSGFQTEFGTELTISCKRGYRLVGAATRTCLQDGTWGEGETLCVKYNCPRLNKPENGEVYVDGGNHAMFGCLEGYTLVGTAELDCLDNDTWSAAAPICAAVQCPDITTDGLPNGRMIFTSLTYTSTIRFECDVGYYISGQRSIECYKDGTWSGRVPKCEKSKCFPPFRMNNGKIVGDDFSYGETIEYICDKGYQLTGGDSVRTCTAIGIWSGNAPSCNLIFCPTPNRSNIIVVGTEYSYGSILEYRCSPGYALEGSASRTCTETGEWSGDEPRCVRSECPIVNELVNGRFNVSSYAAGGRVTFECNGGYSIVGLNFKLCLKQTLQWSNPDPVCEKVTCKNIPTVLHSTYTAREYYYLDTVDYSCSEGYQISGQNFPVCTATGLWSRHDIACVKISCGKPPTPQNTNFRLPDGRLDGEFGDTVDYSCVEGFYAYGTTRAPRCQANGEWSEFAFTCDRVSCPEIGLIKNGRATSAGNRYEDVVTIQCDQGFNLVGNASIVCTAKGGWSGEFIPYCEEGQCKAPSSISNGAVTTLSLAIGAEAIYSCDEGYQLSGNARRVCSKGGLWSGVEPYCRLILCDLPPYVPNAVEFNSFTQYLYKTEVRYVCNAGYSISEGDRILTCSATGKWIGNPPKCSLVQCGEPRAINNGAYSVASYNYLAIGKYFCLTGYRLKGSNIEVVCNKDGQWEGEVPKCVPIDCGPPPTVINSVLKDSGDHTYNNEISYNCDLGYKLVGESVHKCLETGVWSGFTPECEPISCGTPPRIDNAIYTGSNHRYLDKVSYDCFPNYVLKGNRELQCAYDGAWVGERPECLVKTCGPPPVFDFMSVSTTQKRQIGSEATFVCNEGYHRIGSGKAVCRADQKWHYESSAPYCAPVVCGPAPKPSPLFNGTVSGHGEAYGAIVAYTCSKGFYLVSGGELRCGAAGKWIGDVATCAPVFCGPPPVGKNMKAIATRQVN